MCGLQRILSCSGKNTIVLSDELCRGTEVNSSCAIVATTLLHLMKTNTKFFFTTHLHNLVNVQQLNKTYINTCHISVDTKPDGTIVFERTLQPGSGSDLYGLEVCKSIIQNSEFIDMAFDIRNDIMSNATNVIDKGRSRYNKKKIVDHCEVCKHKPKRGEVPLDTHHINEQKNCDDHGFVNGKHFHKNNAFNLVSLCKSCHQKIDTGELTITGYKWSTSGKFLDYNLI
jgi:DNA mismatch repair protein MutS